jgi:hypothetical protein
LLLIAQPGRPSSQVRKKLRSGVQVLAHIPLGFGMKIFFFVIKQVQPTDLYNVNRFWHGP